MQGDCSGLYGAGMVAQFCEYITYHYLYTLSECIVWNVNSILLTVLLLLAKSCLFWEVQAPNKQIRNKGDTVHSDPFPSRGWSLEHIVTKNKVQSTWRHLVLALAFQIAPGCSEGRWVQKIEMSYVIKGQECSEGSLSWALP